MPYNAAVPPSPTSSSSSYSSGPPQTPTSPDPRRRFSDYQTSSLILPTLPDYSSDAYAQQKPKQQNTAERRASHNAVERARRETLNARFLDLAALLPNLKHLRRPSKSAIVNSSIAHVRAARRYRHLASAQLRALNAECDMVRREVNQWRARAGMHPSITPARSEGFALVLGGEEPAFDPIDLEGDLYGEDEEELMQRLPHRRPQATEAACEGPLLLSHPYARKSPPPTYDAAAYAAAPSGSPAIAAYPSASPPRVAAHPVSVPAQVAASFEAPNPYHVDGYMLQQSQQQQQQADAWGTAAYAGQSQATW
ncbi:macrophage erythroblast attacher [Favolaschia claudopus]|uniref:Macrophage erythroblast attacher n=1 Tax=Favolaschia claudopus TaxID=2862362 RepID=A0AAW0CS15_9AGAR